MNNPWKITCLSLLALAGVSRGLELDTYEDAYERMGHQDENGDQLGRWSIFTTQETYDDTEPDLLISREGYDSRSYVVPTQDGYLLKMNRIMAKGPKSAIAPHPVFIQHGLLSSSADWLYLGKGKALPYLLADLGFDVWLGNLRGNTYSRAHMNLSTSSAEFWDFTFHEMGIYDLPAMTEHILRVTGHAQLSYIGHSMGTTTFFIFCAERPELQSRIREMHALAPVAFMSNLRSPLRLASPLERFLQITLLSTKQYEMFQHGAALGLLEQQVLKLAGIGSKSTEIVLGIIAGPDPDQFDKKLLPQILGHVPAGSGTKTMLHYLQEVSSAKFRQYDEGTATANMKRYGRAEPPEYNLENIKVPIYMHYSLNDYLTEPKDIELLKMKLERQTPVRMVQVPFKSFNHMDFLWAKNAKEYVYNSIIDALNRDSAATSNHQMRNLNQWPQSPVQPQQPGVAQELQNLKFKLDNVVQELQSVKDVAGPNEAADETNLEYLKLTMKKAKNDRVRG